MNITLESPNQPDVIALIEALDAYQDTLYPPEARYALNLEALCHTDVLFAVARDERGVAQGCAAVVLGPDHGEVKRMFVTPGARGNGLARQILQTLERAALARGCRALMLETGPAQPDAIAFYERQGFVHRGPFGDYPDHPLSVFMGKPLAKPSA